MRPVVSGALPRITSSVATPLRSASSGLRRNRFSAPAYVTSTQTCKPTRLIQNHRRCFASTTTAAAAALQLGQPLPETHPHLLGPGELTPGITAFEYAERRARLAASLPENAVAVFAAATIKYRSGSVFYRFHQEPDFFYLTGFNEPDAWAVVEKTGPAGSAEHVFHLYVREKDPFMEQWEGVRSGVQAARDIFNAERVGSFEEAGLHLANIIISERPVYADSSILSRQPRSTMPTMLLGSFAKDTRSVQALLSRCKTRQIRHYMNKLRSKKSNAEIDILRKVGQGSGRAFTEAMRHQFATERDLETYLEYQFKLNGCEESAYVPVVAGGSNANQIHYVRNDMALRPDDLVVVDAGGEYGGYVTDITRSWPVNGKFTAAQKDLYQVVLDVQRKCVSLCRETARLSLDGLHDIAVQAMADGLKSIGFDMSRDAIDDLFPHHVGHHIGLAVHDAPALSRNTPLIANECITIEPGIYVPDDERWPVHFRGTGIRIEDSVCVKEDTPLVLTTEAVKEIVDIEALRR